MCDCCDPTHDSPDPVVVRLERELAVEAKIRRYISFTLTGDENSDCQLAADDAASKVVRLEGEVRVLEVGLAELGNRLLSGYRLASQDCLWWLFNSGGEGAEWGDTLESLVRKLGGEE